MIYTTVKDAVMSRNRRTGRQTRERVDKKGYINSRYRSIEKKKAEKKQRLKQLFFLEELQLSWTHDEGGRLKRRRKLFVVGRFCCKVIRSGVM